MNAVEVHVNSNTLLELLLDRHSKDMAVPECKNGSTVFAKHLRMDLWVMKSSWSNPCCWAYEIKVSRSDFMSDDKWPNYLPLCNEFYFVCPRGMIAPEELPPEAGLIWCSKSGTRLFTKKKAPHRSVKIPESLFRYILMHRSNHGGKDKSGVAYWQQWLEEKKVKSDLGYCVSRKIQEIVEERIVKAERENFRLMELNESYAEIRRILITLGYDEKRFTTSQVQRRLEELRDGVPKDFMRSVKFLRNVADQLINENNRLTASAMRK